MINADMRIAPTVPRVVTPFAPAACGSVEAAPPGDAVTLGVQTAAAAPAPPPRRLFGALLAGMMLPAVLGSVLAATPAFAQTSTAQITVSQSQKAAPVAEARAHVQTDIVEEGNTFKLPAGTQKIVFGHGRVATYDGAGKMTGSQKYGSHVMTSTVHSQADPAGHAMITEAADGSIEIHVPAGAVRLQIEPSEMGPRHDSKFNGAVYALDRMGNILASEEHSDIRITPPGSEMLAGATFGVMVGETRDSARIEVPPGTRSLVFNGSQTTNDGSIIALDASGQALKMQPNWGGHLEATHSGPHVTARDEQVTIRVQPGTRQVVLRNGGLQMLDASGSVLAQQPDAGVRLMPGSVE